MPGANIIKAFLQHDATGTKSTVLKPLGWLIGILVSASIASYYFKSPNWVGFTFVLFTGISILLYLISYIHFMRKDPDFLRSESFTLRKLEIEKGFIGDNISGQLSPPPRTVVGVSEANSVAKDEEVKS